MSVGDATAQFFEALDSRGHEPLLEMTSGTMRVELADGKQTERWLVSVDKGDVAVSHRNVKADCTVRAPKDVFDGMVTGEVNAMAALLRGAVAVEGDHELLVLFQRLFPGPPRAASDRKR
jgi:putative sterol carrier protein